MKVKYLFGVIKQRATHKNNTKAKLKLYTSNFKI